MGSCFLRDLSDALDGVEFRRVRWKPEQLDAMAAGSEPLLTGGVESVTRTVVDHEEDLATAGACQNFGSPNT